MAGTAVYVPHAINFASGDDITQLESLMSDFGMEDLVVHSASEVLPGFSGSMFAKPALDMSTTQCKSIIDKMTQDNIAVAGSNSALDLEFRKVTNLTGREAIGSSVNLRLRFLYWLLYWTSVGGRLGALADIAFRICPISNDGTTAPMVYTGSTAITGTSAVQHVFEIGPVSINSTALCTQGWKLDTNVRPREHRCGGSSYFEYSAVESAVPTITIDVEDMTTAMSLLPGGAALSSLTAYLRKKSVSGINVANATEEHISFTASVGTYKAINPKQLKVILHSFSVDTTAAIT